MYKFSWRIENFSMLPQETREFLTANFKVKSLDDATISLHLYPKGDGDSRCLGHKISIDKPQAFEPDTKVKISFFRNNLLFSKEYKINEITVYKSFLKEIIEANRFQDLFLSSDNVDFECVFITHGNGTLDTPVTSSKKTVVQTTNYSYEFPVSEIYLESSTSYKEEHKFCKVFDKLRLCYEFQDSLEDNYIDFKKISPDSSMLSVCCQISLLDDITKNEIELKCDRFTWRASGKKDLWKIPFNIDKCTSKRFKTMRCYVAFSEGNIITIDPNSENTLNQKCFDDSVKNCPISFMKQMHQTKMFSDVVFQVGSHQFPAHKCVLGCASEVFAAMFKSKMVEEDTNVINITDIDKDIVEKMLEFIYTGDVDIADSEDLVRLYFAADKYQILELKKLCSHRLSNALSVGNCLNILKYADMLQDGCLKDAARNYTYVNRKEIPISDWKIFTAQSNTELVADIVFNVCQRT